MRMADKECTIVRGFEVSIELQAALRDALASWIVPPEVIETKRMALADKESQIAMGFEALFDNQAALHALASSVNSAPMQKFRPGQSVLQWWAPWMANAEKTPKQLKKKQRPSWFSGEVISYEGFQEIKYAGSVVMSHTYIVQ